MNDSLVLINIADVILYCLMICSYKTKKKGFQFSGKRKRKEKQGKKQEGQVLELN
jgi:hypothetical protein